MPLRRFDGGCRGPLVSLRLFVVLILVFHAAIGKDKATNVITSANVASADGTSNYVGSSELVTVTDMVTTKRQRAIKDCIDIKDTDTTESILRDCERVSVIFSITTKSVFNMANQGEKQLNEFFKKSPGMTIGIDIHLQDDHSIKTIDFGGVATIGKSLTIKNNKMLKTITGKPDLVLGQDVTVRGNRYLSGDSIKFLESNVNRVKKIDIQKEKECFQDASNPHDFTNCERIYGDLALKNFVQPDNDRFRFKAVTGCFTIANAKNPNKEKVLEIEEFLAEFVTNTSDCGKGHSIDGYCLKNDAQKRIKGAIQGIYITNWDTCEFVCTQDDVFVEEQTGCVTIDGPLSITKDTNKLDLLLKNVKTVNGPVSIDGTKRTTFDFLRSLNAIHSTDSSVPALSITNNREATSFNFMVSNVTSQAETKFLFENNGFNCTDGDRRELLKALKMDSIKCGGEDDPKPNDALEEAKIRGEEGDDSKKEASNDDNGISLSEYQLRNIWIGGTVIALCVVGWFGIWVMIIVCACRK